MEVSKGDRMIDQDTLVLILSFVFAFCGVLIAEGFTVRGTLMMIGIVCLAYSTFARNTTTEV